MRSFTSLSLVALPRVDVLGALTLSAQLVTTADAAGDHPPQVTTALAKLKKARKGLRQARRNATPLVEAANAQAVDRRLDNFYRAFEGFLASWELLGDDAPEAADAQRVRSTMFPDGLKFTQLPYRLQWAASETRIDQLKTGGLAEVVRRLGGERFLKLLVREHARYGDVLAITHEQGDPDDATVRDHYDALQGALRDYVVAVVATAVAGDETAQEKVDRLLKPIADWPLRKPGSGPEAPEDNADLDAPAAAPVVPAPAPPAATAPGPPAPTAPASIAVPAAPPIAPPAPDTTPVAALPISPPDS
jgi:hypothetical protein